MKKRSFLYSLLETVYDIVHLPIGTTWGHDIRELRFELYHADIMRFNYNDKLLKLELSDDGLKKIKKRTTYYNKSTPIIILYVDDQKEILRLAKSSNIGSILYGRELIWQAMNDEDKALQIKTLQKFIV